MTFLEGKNQVRSRIVDSQHSFNFHRPENPAAAQILRGAFHTAQERILETQQEHFPHAVLSLGQVSIPRRIVASGVHSIQYDSVQASTRVNRFQETVKETITRLQLPIDSIRQAVVLYGETSSPEIVMVLDQGGKETTIIISESEWKDWSGLGMTPSSMVFVEAKRERLGANPRDLEQVRIGLKREPGKLFPPTMKPVLNGAEGKERGRRIHDAKEYNEEVVRDYAGSIWVPSWNRFEVRSLSYRPAGENKQEIAWHPDDENTEGVLIDNFNQFIEGADFEGKLLGS